MTVGDELDQLARVHGDALFRLALLLAPNRSAAEDLVQECFVRVALRLGRVPEAGRFAYCRRVLVNVSIDEGRRQSRLRRLLPLLATQPHQPDTADPLAAAASMRDLLLTLPPRQRATVVLRYWADLPESEIAALLGCSVGTVKSQLSRGLTALRLAVSAAAGEEVPRAQRP